MYLIDASVAGPDILAKAARQDVGCLDDFRARLAEWARRPYTRTLDSYADAAPYLATATGLPVTGVYIVYGFRIE